MNWTGGRLSRHSRNANASLTQRQKQHFAKARGNILKRATIRSPLRWSLFDNVAADPSGRNSKPSTPTLSRSHITRPPQELVSNCSMKNRRSPLPEHRFGSSQRAHGPRSSKPCANGMIKEAVNLEGPPLSQVLKRKPDTLSPLVGSHQNVEDESESWEERRRQILGKGDWVGASIQRPISLKYKTISNDERMGKRRRLDSGDQPHFGAIKQPIITSPFGVSGAKIIEHRIATIDNLNLGTSATCVAGRKNRVRISIGGRQVNIGTGSSSTHSQAQRVRAMSSQASASDTMLLDEEDMNRQIAQISKDRHHLPVSLARVGVRSRNIPSPLENKSFHTPHRQRIVSPFDNSFDLMSQVASPPTHVPRGYTYGTSAVESSIINTTRSSQLSEGNVMRYTRHPKQSVNTSSHPQRAILHNSGDETINDIVNNEYGHEKEVAENGITIRSSPPSESYISDISKQLSESSRKLQSLAQDKSRRHHHLSPRPQLLHPTPQTLRTSQILRPTSSEDISSTAGQLGMPNPAITESQELDEEIWKTWIFPEEVDGAIEKSSECVDSKDVSISPGISAIVYAPSHDNMVMPKVTSREGILQSLENSQNIDSQPEGNQGEKYQDDTLKKDKQDQSFQVDQEVESIWREPVTEAVDYKNLFLPRAKKISLPLKLKQHENPDDAWMKFILSDNSEDEERGLNEDQQHQQLGFFQTPRPRHESSMGVHYSNETNSNIQSQHSSSGVSGQAVLSEGLSIYTDAATSTSGQDLPTSNHATQGTNPSSEPESAPNFQLQNEPHHRHHSDQFRNHERQKVTFTKPRRFTNHKASSSPDPISLLADKSLHIGARRRSPVVKHMGADHRSRISKGGRGRQGLTDQERGRRTQKGKGRDIYSLESMSEATGDEEEDDIESFEDF